MFRALAVCFGIPLIAAASLEALGQRAGVPAERALLDKYCVTCHNQTRPAAGLALDALDVTNVAAAADVWEKVAGKLRHRAMPPPGLPRPDAATSDTLASSLEAALDRASNARPNPGRAVIHRLNRAEYANVIRDLLALEIDGRALLPSDDQGYGFDNIADVLSTSPALFERYMIAAGKISQLAVGNPSMRPTVQTYRVPPTLLQDDRMSEDLPFGTRGGMVVRHHFPLDGDYLIKVRLQRTHASQIRGLGEPNDIEIRLDRQRLQTFTIGGDGPRDPWSAVPSASVYEQTADQGLEVRAPVKAGQRMVGVAFPRKSGLPEGALPPQLSVATYEYAGDRDGPMSVERIEISGPFNATLPEDTPSRRRLFVCYPARAQEEEPCATKVLSMLARRAYRRPVERRDLDTLLGFYRTGRAKGSFDAGIELALRAVLVDPDFLFRVERDPAGLPAGTVHRLNEFELASRLSFFLWSSMPDDALLAEAEAGKLGDPAILNRQIARMLADGKSSALVSNFAGQWLHLRNLRTAAPDPEAFPEFDENLRDAFRRETELFVESQLRDDRPVAELLSANYTFLNERLARHYGVAGVRGSHFRRVPLTDEARRGLLGHGSILTVTSYANRTSPTLRGKWVLENLLGAPPPAPPPDVPGLPDDEAGAGLTVRERMEQHRRNAVCASCHAPMDPLGLALEPFDAIGKRRTHDGNSRIDASAALPDGATFDGPSGLRGLLLERTDLVAATVTEKLLTYALGRGLEPYDRPAVRQILREAAPANSRWSSLIAAIVKSMPFQMRTAESGNRVIGKSGN